LQHDHRRNDPVQVFCYGMILLTLQGITVSLVRLTAQAPCLPASQPKD
jgi:hypothetical protein